MPGATLPNTGVTLPELGGDPGVWDDETNAAWENYDVHDHTPGKGVRIKTAAISIDADLSMAGHALTSIGTLAFSKVAALASGAVSLFVSSADSELYWRTNGGVNVKLTNANGINTTLVGGIAGDYAAVGAEVAYDDADDVYTFKQEGSPRPWARIASADVRLYEYNTTETVFVGLKVPATLAATYELTLPVALPAVVQPIVVGNTGQLQTGKAFALDADQDITLSGTGYVKHGTDTILVPLTKNSCYVKTGSLNGDGAPGIELGANNEIYIPLPPLSLRQRVVNVSLYYDSAADATACTAELVTSSAALPAIAGFTATSDFLTAGGTSKATFAGINFQSTAANNSQTLWIKVTNSTGGERIAALAIDVDVP